MDRKAALQREIDMLRKQGQTSSGEAVKSGSSPTQESNTDVQTGVSGLVSNFSNQSLPSAFNAPQTHPTTTSPNNLYESPVLSRNAMSRSLDGVFVDGVKVDDCFAL